MAVRILTGMSLIAFTASSALPFEVIFEEAFLEARPLDSQTDELVSRLLEAGDDYGNQLGRVVGQEHFSDYCCTAG